MYLLKGLEKEGVGKKRENNFTSSDQNVHLSQRCQKVADIQLINQRSGDLVQAGLLHWALVLGKLCLRGHPMEKILGNHNRTKAI